MKSAPCLLFSCRTGRGLTQGAGVLLALTVVLIVGNALPAGAQTSVFLVRHAERADTVSGAAPTMGADPDLSAAGRARAESLAKTLKDAGITAIFTTEYKRTQQTAAPIAEVLGIVPEIVRSTDAAGLLARVKSAAGNVLVVGHSNTVPEAIKGLGVDTTVTIGDAEYDNLFVVVRACTPALVRLHYR